MSFFIVKDSYGKSIRTQWLQPQPATGHFGLIHRKMFYSREVGSDEMEEIGFTNLKSSSLNVGRRLQTLTDFLSSISHRE